ncbi:MAG: hypothetical protein EBZ91_06545 [Gammaproteobacteria bacterium]|nr:hypothetical protein [Gammaproteobacteria bacterium]
MPTVCRLGALCALVALWAAAAGAIAAEPPEETLPQGNFAFAHRLGSGIYEISGRTVQVYRLPFEWQWREPSERHAGVMVTVPITLGFFDFKPELLLEEGLPTDVSTLAVVPGLRWNFSASDIWHISPFIEAGVARDRRNDRNSQVFTAGLEISRTDPSRFGPLRQKYSAIYALSSTDEVGRDSLVQIVGGFEVPRELRRAPGRKPWGYAPYTALRWYPQPPGTPLLAVRSAQRVAPLQAEVGIMFGPLEPVRVGRFTLPRVGLSYRVGRDLQAVSLVFGEAF